MRPVTRLRSIGFGLVLVGAVIGSVAAGPQSKVINLGAMSVSIAWDAGWQLADAAANAPPNSAQFQAAKPSDLLVMLSGHVAASDAGIDAAMRSMVDDNAKEFLGTSVQKSLPVEAFKDGATHGYEVCATDRAPKPDEWKYVCKGMAAMGDLVVGYTVLYNEPGRRQAERAVKALRAMQISKGV
jgi:hypothetical protein